MFLVAPPSPPSPPSPPPPHANACTSHNFVTNTPLATILYKNAQKACGISNCVTNSPINFIFGIAIDYTKWKNPIVFGANRTSKMDFHFEKKLKKIKSCVLI